MKMQDGEALGALHHDEIGDIDLVWGKAGTKKSDGYGLAKLVKFHPEVLDNLQGILDGMHITMRSENRVQLESDEYQAAVRLTWNGKEKLWLLTAFKKKETPEPTNSRTDVDSNLDGKSDDTATRQSADVSTDKVTESSPSTQENRPKNSTQSAVKSASAEVETSPTEAQKKAGNYKMGHVKVGAFDVTIENPKGSERSGTDANGKKWSVKMNNTYGYIRGTEGVDGDTYASIGKWAGKSERRLRRYNEVPRRAALSPGDVVFLEKKRKKAARVLKHTYHTVRPGDSLHAISQRYGMRVETIYKNNGIPLGGPIAVGQKLRIR